MKGRPAVGALLLVAGVPALLEGVAGVVNPRWIVRWYTLSSGASVALTPEMSYLVNVLGIYLIAFGAMLMYASRDPQRCRFQIGFGASVMLARGIQRLVLTDDLNAMFHVPAWLNVLNAGYVIVLASALLWLRPSRHP